MRTFYKYVFNNFVFQYDLPFVEVYRAREFNFRTLVGPNLYRENESTPTPRLNTGFSVWNCDGEVIQSDHVKIR